MHAFSRRYTQISEFLDERPNFAADWKWLAVIAVLSYAVTLAVRIMEAGAWSQPGLSVAGEAIMATHDTYGWLAGAKGVNQFAHYGLSGLARGLAALTGAPLWKIAFWGPAWLGSLLAVVTALWGWLLGGRRTAILAGAIGGLLPGFYMRSRLGYFDTDTFTLIMPLTIGLMLAVLLSFCCSRAWVASEAERREEGGTLPGAAPWLALGFGLFARVAHFAHYDIRIIGILLYWGALVLAGLTARPGRRLQALGLLVVYGITAYVGVFHQHLGVFSLTFLDYVGIAVAAALAFLLWKRPEAARPVLDHPWVWLAALVAVVFLGDLLSPLGPFWTKAVSYFKPVAEVGGAGAGGVPGPKYPGITQSIREAKNVADWGNFLAGVSITPWVGGLSALGLLAALALRPALALMLPLIVLGMLSLFMGVRFAMFGGPAFALGLALGLHWLLKAVLDKTGVRESVFTLAQIVVAGACLVTLTVQYKAMNLTPVVAEVHAAALMKLRAVAPGDAQVWTWWDYGYATQYYAERMTPTDGGKHAGRDIYPTALALTTPSYRQSAQVMLLSASLGDDPAAKWDKLPARDVQAALEGLAQTDQPLAKVPTQYVVACWENINLLYWMTYYGSWDLVAGRGTHAKTQDVREAFNVDQARGAMVFRASAPILISSVDMLTAQGTRRATFPGNAGHPHLIINDVVKQVILLDDLAYNSMAVQLLIGDAARPEQARYFKLVHEGYPLVRIYEVLPPATQAKVQTEAFTQ